MQAEPGHGDREANIGEWEVKQHKGSDQRSLAILVWEKALDSSTRFHGKARMRDDEPTANG